MPLVPVPLDRHASFLKDTIVNSDRTGTHDTDKYRSAVPIDTIWEMWKFNCVIVTSLDHVRFRLHRVRHREGPVLRPEPLGGEREGGVAGQLPLDQLHPGAWTWAWTDHQCKLSPHRPSAATA